MRNKDIPVGNTLMRSKSSTQSANSRHQSPDAAAGFADIAQEFGVRAIPEGGTE